MPGAAFLISHPEQLKVPGWVAYCAIAAFGVGTLFGAIVVLFFIKIALDRGR